MNYAVILILGFCVAAFVDSAPVSAPAPAPAPADAKEPDEAHKDIVVTALEVQKTANLTGSATVATTEVPPTAAVPSKKVEDTTAVTLPVDTPSMTISTSTTEADTTLAATTTSTTGSTSSTEAPATIVVTLVVVDGPSSTLSAGDVKFAEQVNASAANKTKVDASRISSTPAVAKEPVDEVWVIPAEIDTPSIPENATLTSDLINSTNSSSNASEANVGGKEEVPTSNTKWIIAGSVIAGVVVLVLVTSGVIFLRHRKNRRAQLAREHEKSTTVKYTSTTKTSNGLSK